MQTNYKNDYLNYMETKGAKLSTIKRYSYDLDKFILWMIQYKGSVELNTLLSFNERDLEAYIAYLTAEGYSDATFRRLISVINQFLKYLNINSTILQEEPKERPVRALNANDFISDEEIELLLKSISRLNDSEARNHLIDRNLGIVCLSRYYGLTPKDISSLRMNDVNLAQKTIKLNSNNSSWIIRLQDEHIRYIQDYRNSIDERIRPRYRSNDPLFVSFFNLTLSFRFNYDADMPQPLSIRAIQEMVKDEVKLAGLRKISMKHLRNSCIMDHLSKGYPVDKVISYFRLSGPVSIRRYQEFLKKSRGNKK